MAASNNGMWPRLSHNIPCSDHLGLFISQVRPVLAPLPSLPFSVLNTTLTYSSIVLLTFMRLPSYVRCGVAFVAGNELDYLPLELVTVHADILDGKSCPILSDSH